MWVKDFGDGMFGGNNKLLVAVRLSCSPTQNIFLHKQQVTNFRSSTLSHQHRDVTNITVAEINLLKQNGLRTLTITKLILAEAHFLVCLLYTSDAADE